MTYSETQQHYQRMYTNRSYNECKNAIKDIDETLDIWQDKPMNDLYVQKLWLERDEAIARKFKLDQQFKKLANRK